MNSEAATASAETQPRVSSPPSPARPIRVWPAIVLLLTFWAFYVGVNLADLPIYANFLSHAAATALLLLVFPLWWLTNGTVSRRERLSAFGVALTITVVAVLLTWNTLQPIGALFFGLPVLFTVWTCWLIVSHKFSPRARSIGLAALLAAAWTPTVLMRMDGLTGDLKAQLSWRWSATAEDRFLAKRAKKAAAGKLKAADGAEAPLVLQPGDWPELRGPNRGGEIRGVRIDTDWQANPPKLLWRHEVGPAWSSMVVIGQRLFTQEQRGPKEAVTALDANTGREIWSHENKTRFWDSQSGAGPRATPTFVDGRIYAVGATGILDCLDATSGRLEWTRDIKVDSGAALPIWGYSCSPLVTDGVVVVYAGGPSPRGLIAYRAADGSPAWNVPTGAVSYSSPQLVEVDSQPQILFMSDEGLVAVQPADGEILWRYDATSGGVWRAIQPRQVSESDVVIGSEDLGLVRLAISRRDGKWHSAERYATKSMKPAYNDFEVFDQSAYGFDGGIFCAVDLIDGKRQWKAGRYGHGQALAIVDQNLLVVITETGEVVLLVASPKSHEELGRFQAIAGKTWNHPAFAQGRLYVRNDEEMACYEIKLESR